MKDIEQGKKDKDEPFVDFSEINNSNKFDYYAKPESNNSRSSTSASQLPPLFVDFKGTDSSRTNPFNARNEFDLLDRILSKDKSIFGDSKAGVAQLKTDLAGKDSDAKPDNKANDNKVADNKTATNDSSDKRADVTPPKGPVKLDQVKFNTDDVAKAFQIAKENNLPVIVYKGADFCHNCPPVSRAIDGLADKIKGAGNTEAVVVKLNWERQQQLQKQNPELAKMIEQLMPSSGSSFPDVKVYNPNDLSKPLKDGNGYGGDAQFLQSLIATGKEAMAQNKGSNDNKQDARVDKKPEPQLDVKPQPQKDTTSDRVVGKDEVKLADGTYKLDASGRVSETKSADGSLSRQFKYEDASNPNKITSYVLNGKTEFKRIGENSFAVYNLDSMGKRNLAGNWHGQMEMGKNGVFSFKEWNESTMHRRGASASELSTDQIAQRSELKQGGDNNKSKVILVDFKDKVEPSDRKEKPQPGPSDNHRSALDDRPPAKELPDALPDLKITSLDSKTVKLEDGTYKRDDQGRVVETISADGKTKRNFKYDDAAFPNRITAETINDKTTYKFIGNNRIGGEPYKIDGKEVNSYSIYDEKGNLQGNWSGIREMSPNGVYAYKDDKQEKIEFKDAGNNNLSEKEKTSREEDGIWPGQLDITRDDGSTIHADLNGKRLASLTETVKENGKEREVSWKKDGDKWVSNETPARERKNMSITADGTIKFESMDGKIKNELYKNGTRSETNKDGTRKSFNKEDQVTEIKQANGDSRSFNYDGATLSSIADKVGDKQHNWTRKPGTDEWTNGSKTETRKDLKIAADASIKFTNADGLSVTETAELARITADDKNRPVKVEYPNGSMRSIAYKNDKVDSITDLVKTADKDKVTTWARKGDSNEFTSTDANGKTKTRQDFDVKPSGDYSYKTQDGKDHTSRSYDLERQARGEIVVGSESMQEARDRFLDLAKDRGLKTDRLEKYFNQLEESSKRYGTTPEQISKAVDNLADIMDAEKSPIYSKQELLSVVETGMHNIANPSEIDQGYHPTCNVTTTEVYAAARFPEKYTDLLKQVALTGSYQTSYGTKVTPPEKALKPGRDEKNYDLDNANIDKRNQASQIYQMTAVNGVYELGKHSSEKDGKDNGTRYVLGEVRKKPIPNGFIDQGEDLLLDKSGNPKMRNGEPIDGPEFIQDDVITASEMITGTKMPYIEAPYKLETEANWHFDLPTSERLFKAKQDGQFPMGVPTIRGAHVQTIHDVTRDRSGNTWVLLDNQHGIQKDGWVPLSDLHKTQTQDIQLDPTRKPWQRPDQ